MTNAELKEKVEQFTEGYFNCIQKQNKRRGILNAVVGIAREYGADYALLDSNRVVMRYPGLGFGSILSTMIEDRLDGINADYTLLCEPGNLELTFTLLEV